jgi:lactoylglutathione lyase
MHIEHVALWTQDLDRLKTFYETYFGAVANDLYRSRRRPFESYFLTFASGARLELMKLPGIDEPRSDRSLGYTHLALSTGSREAVDALVARLRQDGIRIVFEPRVTGDGYYESVVEDPDGNEVEITI